MNGQARPATAPPAAAAAAIWMKSRRFGSSPAACVSGFAPATVSAEADRLRAVFDEPQFSVTPGQVAVFYDGDTVLASGTIEKPPQI